MVVLVTCKNGEDQIKNEALEWSQHFIQAFIVVLLICKYEEDPFKIESTREVTSFLPF